MEDTFGLVAGVGKVQGRLYGSSSSSLLGNMLAPTDSANAVHQVLGRTRDEQCMDGHLRRRRAQCPPSMHAATKPGLQGRCMKWNQPKRDAARQQTTTTQHTMAHRKEPTRREDESLIGRRLPALRRCHFGVYKSHTTLCFKQLCQEK